MPSAPPSSQKPSPSVIILGSGFAGIGMGIRLKQAGLDDFVILERADDVGGTWRDNRYPGCACDVQSHLYSFSFEPNPNWSRMYAGQDEIHQYIHHCVAKYGLTPHIKLGQEVRCARYDEAEAMWTVETASGQIHRARILVTGLGLLNKPAIPEYPGSDSFQGARFHSATWNHGFDLDAKRVAVIGTGASAIQFVPGIADRVGHIDLYQRTAHWVVPKHDRPIRPFERLLFRLLPVLQRLARRWIYWLNESRVVGLVVRPGLMKIVERNALAFLASEVTEPALRAKLTPSYTIGCKRILLSNDWYRTLARSHVEVVTDPIERITPTGIVTRDGVERPADAIIYGTGFNTQQPIGPGMIFGRDGRDLGAEWIRNAEAYKGSTVAGFPNLFMLGGPNTLLGHSSVIYMHEAQVTYVMDAIQTMRREGLRSLEVAADAQRAYNEALQAREKQTVWQSGCKSWYLNEEGRNTTLWPDFTFRFKRQLVHFDSDAYRAEPA